jgi:5-methyltetrahydrofolate--homocysteine methyltransferase
MVDKIPYVPRIDLWYNANQRAGTLPEKHKNRSADEIALAEGWALHKIVPEFLKPDSSEDIVHRGLGLVHLKEYTYRFEFSPDIDIIMEGDADQMRVVYETPLGSVSTTHGYTEEMKDAGASAPWIQEHAIKGPGDYKVLAHIFGNMTFKPDYDRFDRWESEIGDHGLALESTPALNAGSPMHYIQKVLIDATQFFIHYNDYSMITYPAYLKKDLLPWWQKAAEIFHARDKLLFIHPDGENNLLMDILADCGADVCEAVTPFPMTKVGIDEYYDRWCRSGKLTIWGGIPESILLEKSATEEDFKAYLDHLFKAVVPGDRFIAGIGDTTPPGAVFDRLVRLGERIETEGRLPLKAGAAVLLSPELLTARPAPTSSSVPSDTSQVLDKDLRLIQEDVLKGDNVNIKLHVQHALAMNYAPQDILNLGLLSAMEIIGGRFKDGTVFIPEVLLSARAMNEALTVLEPLLAADGRIKKGKILIGTVRGDLHDIGKNLVSTMLKGVGYDIVDLGINVAVDEFVHQVSLCKPDILAISALLTTTMPQMEHIIGALQKAGLRSKVMVMVGGAPVNDKFARDIGADGYAQDAGEAVELAGRLIDNNKLSLSG